MHIILGLLSAIATILIIVNRLNSAGVDLKWIGWLNPFAFMRRRQWSQKYHSDPIFSITDPKESAGGLLYAAAKCSGELSREDKNLLLSTYEHDFHQSNREATELMSSFAFLLKDEDTIYKNMEKYLAPSIEKYSVTQKESVIELLEKVVSENGTRSEKQADFIKKARLALENNKTTSGEF